MALPVLIGLPWLGGVLGSFFSALFSFFATYVTKRLALVAAAVVLLISLTAAFWAALEGLVSGLSFALPAPYVAMFDHFVPGNATACLSIVISARLFRYVYDWNSLVVRMKML